MFTPAQPHSGAAMTDLDVELVRPAGLERDGAP